MHLLLLGASHHNAPVDLRERVDFSRRGIPEALKELETLQDIYECVVLSTCNRSEIYTVCTAPDTAQEALAVFMSSFHDVPEPELAPYLYKRTNQDAARHLFRVVSGLDSLVIGEPQIAGQVKEAFQIASEQGFTGASLNRLFHCSFRVGKQVRTETGLGEGAVSVSYAAISLARKIFGDLSQLKALVLGAGEMAELTTTHLKAQPVGAISVANRTPSRAAALAAKVNGNAVSWETITEELTSTDIVVTATGSSKRLLTREHIQRAMKPRRNRPLFIIDIGVPRDVEPTAGEVEQVFLYNIDDLQTIVRDNLSKRQSQIDRAELMVHEEVDGFMAWLGSRGAIPTVIALRRRFEQTRQNELKRLAPKLAGLSPNAKSRVEEITRLLVEKLLSTPTEQLKAASNEQEIAADTDALVRLFKLTDQTPEETRDKNEHRSSKATNSTLPSSTVKQR
tara:strand:+ start:45 stop:1400 length:1356 start_codon:yes stop_codon:yes gene_type:complete